MNTVFLHVYSDILLVESAHIKHFLLYFLVQNIQMCRYLGLFPFEHNWENPDFQNVLKQVNTVTKSKNTLVFCFYPGGEEHAV